MWQNILKSDSAADSESMSLLWQSLQKPIRPEQAHGFQGMLPTQKIWIFLKSICWQGEPSRSQFI